MSSRLPVKGLGASILAPWGTILASRENPGNPGEQRDGYAGVRNRIFIDFGLIFGPCFESFLGIDA